MYFEEYIIFVNCSFISKKKKKLKYNEKKDVLQSNLTQLLNAAVNKMNRCESISTLAASILIAAQLKIVGNNGINEFILDDGNEL